MSIDTWFSFTLVLISFPPIAMSPWVRFAHPPVRGAQHCPYCCQVNFTPKAQTFGPSPWITLGPCSWLCWKRSSPSTFSSCLGIQEHRLRLSQQLGSIDFHTWSFLMTELFQYRWAIAHLKVTEHNSSVCGWGVLSI